MTTLAPLIPTATVPLDAARISYSTRELTRVFPGVLAVDHVSLDVRQGEVHGVIGKNGAGKTVLMSLIAGIYPATSGALTVGSDEIDTTHHTPANARTYGIALVPQEPVIAKGLSVADNIFMGRRPTHRGLIAAGAEEQRLSEVCERLGVNVRAGQPMDSLRIEDQQMLALGRALYVDHARVLLLDEITASLPRAKKQVLLNTLKRAISERPEISITLITHQIDEVLEFCDRVTVMRDGRAVQTLEVPRTTKAILAAWIVGTDVTQAGAGRPTHRAGAAPAAPHLVSAVGGPSATPASGPVYAAEGISLGAVLDELSFELTIGEVLGIAGLDGSGKDELFGILAGLRRPDRGTLKIASGPIVFNSPIDARRAGVAYLPKKRDQYAVISGRSVQENALATVYPKLTRFGVIDTGRAHHVARESVDSLRVKTPALDTVIDHLSGGNRQKTMIARVVNGEPTVYLLNEPTRGVDLATKPEILAAIRERLSRHAGVILTSESEEELVEACDRVIVLYHGRVVGDLHRGDEGFQAAEMYRLLQGVST